MNTDMTLTQLLTDSAERHEGLVALRMRQGESWEEWTYSRFHRATQMARRFVEEGMQPGERVIVYAESQPTWAVVYFACAAAGLTVVPLDPQTTADEVASVAEFTDARMMFVSDGTLTTLRLEDPTSWEREPYPIPTRRFSELDYSEASGEQPIFDLGKPDATTSIIFTAGTTVDPKGVLLSHRNFMTNVRGVSVFLPPEPWDEFLSLLPLNHAFEFSNGLLIPLSAGSTVTYAGSLNPRTILQTIRDTKTTVILAMPRLYEMCAEIARRRAESAEKPMSDALRDLFGEHMRVLVSGGAALDPDVYKAYFEAGLAIHEGYGLTEAAPVLTVTPMYRTRQGSVGLALPGVDVRIESPDGDGIGEIVARGDNVMRGYFRNEAATAKVLRDGWLCTGDLGYLDDDNYLHITGRSKDVIVTSAGKNVYPDEVELLYKGLPHVRTLCVVGVKDAHRREETHAVLVVSEDLLDKPNVKREIHQAIQNISGRIPSYQRIQHVHYWTTDLPATHSGRVKRVDVREMLAERLAGVDAPEPTEIAEWLPKAWESELIVEIARITGIDPARIRPGHNFDQDLHLDSLMKVELLAMLETRLGLALPEHIALKFQTVQHVFDYLTPHMGDWDAEIGCPKAHTVTLDALHLDDDDTQYLEKTPVEAFIAAGFRSGIRLVYRLIFGLDGDGIDRLPKSGAYIIAANHSSHLDSGAVLALLGKTADNVHV
ncbi:MAG: AMP-binding protein, partial [Candidatus Poribacteria bacterium]|nr:AMP-binding protein [Candidatus Poribacteria bacterium]